MEMFEKIYENHIQTLTNTNTNQKKTLICFSGVSGSGKSTISEHIAKRYKGVTYSSDDVRQIISNLGLADSFKDKHNISKQYLRWFLANYKFSNGIIIMDNDISSKYSDVRNLLPSWRFFLIQILVKPETAQKRVKQREKEFRGFDADPIERLRAYEKFNSDHRADLVIDNQGDLDIEKVFKAIDEFLKK